MEPPSLEIIAAIYDAAVDRTRWPAALERIRNYVGVTGIQLMAVDRRLGIISFSATANLSHDAELEYVRRYCAIDPRVKVLLADAPGTWLLCHELLSDEFVATDPFYQGLIIPNGLRYVAGCKVYEDENISMVLGLHQGLGRAPVSRDQTARADLIAPHLKRATQLSLNNFVYSSLALVGMEIVNRLRYPVFLLKSDGYVVHTNTAAEALLGEPDALLRLDGLRPFKEYRHRRRQTHRKHAEQLRCRHSERHRPRTTQPTAQVLSLRRDPASDPSKAPGISPLHPQSVMGIFGPQRLMMAAFSDPTKNALHRTYRS